jgi:hypothetical protein
MDGDSPYHRPYPAVVMTRLRYMIPAALAAVLLTGCGPDSASPNGPASGAGGGTPTGPNQPAARPTCDLAPASLVNATLGTHVSDPEAQNLNKVVVCRYKPTSGTGSVVVRIQTDMSPQTFATSRSLSDTNGIPTSDLPGFQDNAYTSVLKAGSIVTNTLVALKGTVEILVSSPASFDAEKNLETQLFAKLA